MRSPAFSDYKDFPSIFSQFTQISLISGNITLSFCLPEFGIGRRFDLTITAFVHVPEKAVDKYDFIMSCKNYIRITRQVFTMKGITVPHSVNNRSNYHLGLSILVTNTRHKDYNMAARRTNKYGMSFTRIGKGLLLKANKF